MRGVGESMHGDCRYVAYNDDKDLKVYNVHETTVRTQLETVQCIGNE
jgi:hypothetical protein